MVYNQRLKELLQHITVEIMEAVNGKTSYSINYIEFINLIKDISTRLTELVTMIKNEEAFKSTLEYEFKGLFRSLTEEDFLMS